MNIKQAFGELSVWKNTAETELSALLSIAEPLACDSQSILAKQYHPARYFYFVFDGELQFFIQLTDEDDHVQVASFAGDWFAVGWSGFRKPHLYATTVKCDKSCLVLRWRHDELQQFLNQYPATGYQFLALVLRTSMKLLDQTRLLLEDKRPMNCLAENTLASECHNKVDCRPEWLLGKLKCSSFFEGFNVQDLDYFSKTAQLLQFDEYNSLLDEKSYSEGLYILIDGAVYQYKTSTYIRTLDCPGQIVAWSSDYLVQHSGLSSRIKQDTLLCFIPENAISSRIKDFPELGLVFINRLLLLAGEQLRSARIKLIHQSCEEEHSSIVLLLQQAGPVLGVDSVLHQIPHLLHSRLTHGQVFVSLERLKQEGTNIEKSLASLCLELLTETRREWNFYRGLLNVYETVVSSSELDTTSVIKHKCEKAFQNAFAQVSYVIQGQENLPNTPGHIFILNHLISHPYNMLPNNFELSLDTHFVSSMILNPKYGNGGVRVVRQPRNNEFAHQRYYERLGNIFVVTNESDKEAQFKVERKQQLSEFIQKAQTCLQKNQNLVICPEGTSRWSEGSPGPFKPGAFMLAGNTDPEPLIVPIAVANFDKPLRNTTLAAVIKPAFYISDHADVKDKQSIKHFLSNYQTTYQRYVEEAQQLALQSAN